VGVGGIGTNLSLNEMSLGVPMFIHPLPSPQHTSTSPDHLLILQTLKVVSGVSEICVS